ncbi:MAG: 30S ribosomal protein S2 [Alphaproteobacteria bacterium]|nr:30S ribosomal protein S2 [Alphaproteobacteria bacterium]
MLPTFTIDNLLEAGVHFGHNVRRWNPRMAPYVFGVKDNIHIINLKKTAILLHEALKQVEKIASKGGKVLFVGTKKQSRVFVQEIAQKIEQFYVNEKWFGGILTNWNTISQSISRMKKLKVEIDKAEELGFNKKEILTRQRQYDKLQAGLGGIDSMHGLPQVVIVFDIVKDNIAVKEARKLKIPVIGICDSNADPEQVDFVVPGNDDSFRAIKLYGSLFTQAFISGLEKHLVNKPAKPKVHKVGADKVDGKKVEKPKRKSNQPEFEKVISKRAVNKKTVAKDNGVEKKVEKEIVIDKVEAKVETIVDKVVKTDEAVKTDKVETKKVETKKVETKKVEIEKEVVEISKEEKVDGKSAKVESVEDKPIEETVK